jgi:hypothetical protein
LGSRGCDAGVDFVATEDGAEAGSDFGAGVAGNEPTELNPCQTPVSEEEQIWQ